VALVAAVAVARESMLLIDSVSNIPFFQSSELAIVAPVFNTVTYHHYHYHHRHLRGTISG